MTDINPSEDYLILTRDAAEHAERIYCRAIVITHDDYGWTFRQIGASLGIAHSWAYKLYKKGKAQDRQE